MKKNRTIIRICLILLICLTFKSETFAENKNEIILNDISLNTIVHPDIYQPFKFRSSLSVMFTSIPIDWIEITIDAPIFQFSTKMGLPLGFTLNGTIETALISNQFKLGGDWNYEIGSFSMSLGLDGIFLLGYLPVMEFKNYAHGFSVNPNISFGYKTKEIAFTINTEYNYTNLYNISSGNSNTDPYSFNRPGGLVSFFIEQKLWNDKVMILGLISNFNIYYFPAWPAFHVFQKVFYIPQVQIGLVL
ncbi:MAG: hypothetical protein KA807_04155 [Prolixibacteraceae bacterium]|nr:hypothetical protein [Prolixibacteraceae bacterium]